jgi:hypothetical protein
MYSKQEISQLRHQFWTVFGKYMTPVISAEGEKINWINYKTNKKGVSFRMDADNKKASIAITIEEETALQQLYFEKLFSVKKLLEDETGEEWLWQPVFINERNNNICRIYKEIKGVSVFNKEDWPIIISFFKPRIIALDKFWSIAKEIIEL